METWPMVGGELEAKLQKQEQLIEQQAAFQMKFSEQPKAFESAIACQQRQIESLTAGLTNVRSQVHIARNRSTPAGLTTTALPRDD
jgi:hypothetical protein